MENKKDNEKTAGGRITAVVLASGLSRRMGCNKLLMEVDGRPMIGHILNLLKDFHFRRVLVVTSYGEIMTMARTFGYETVYNDNPAVGQSRSVVLGVKASLDSEGWLFFNGDMPWLGRDTIERIIAAADKGKIIVPRYGGCPGQPVYFADGFYHELMELTGDQGGRQIIRKHPESVRYIDIEDGQQGRDVDTAADLAAGEIASEIVNGD